MTVKQTDSLATVQFRAMGTNVEIALVIETQHRQLDVEDAFRAVRGEILTLEQKLSRFHPDSEVSRINQQPGRFVHVSEATVCVVELALEAYNVSNGLFCPWVGGIMEGLGYNVSFEQIDQGIRGLSRTVKTAAPSSKWVFFSNERPPLHVQRQAGLVSVDPGFRLDLGGLAKGWIVEQTAAALLARGFQNLVVSAGGDMVCRGRHPNGPWTVGIENPWGQPEHLFTLDVENLALATSGTYRRRWQTTEGEVHHLIDPRTGRPSTSDVVSCSVLSNRLTGAEVLAKTVLLLGHEQGERWIRDYPHRGFVLITQDKEVVHTWNSSTNGKSRQ